MSFSPDSCRRVSPTTRGILLRFFSRMRNATRAVRGTLMRVGIYARVSTIHGQTCENQLLELRRYEEVRGGRRRNT
jgi:hypothetical protein